ncbi:MAG: head GIN domain-containing protein [Bacteroidia bacterium]
MKKQSRLFKLLPLAAVLVLLLPSCLNRFGIHGEGSPVTQQRTPGTFNAVALNIDADVVLHTDSAYRIELTGQQNILDVLRTNVTGNELVIDFSDCVTDYSPLTIHVYAPVYVQVSICGSGNVSNTGALNAANVKMKINGSGNLSLSNLQCTTVESDITGSGNITLTGTSQTINHKSSGSGEFKAFGLTSNAVDISVSGSGNAELNASQNLTVDISGSGNVYYRGTPAINVSISGSGRVIHVN